MSTRALLPSLLLPCLMITLNGLTADSTDTPHLVHIIGRISQDGDVHKQELWIRGHERFWRQFFEAFHSGPVSIDFCVTNGGVRRRAGELYWLEPERSPSTERATTEQRVFELVTRLVLDQEWKVGKKKMALYNGATSLQNQKKDTTIVTIQGWASPITIILGPFSKSGVLSWDPTTFQGLMPAKWIAEVDIASNRLLRFEVHAGKRVVPESRVLANKKLEYQKAEFVLLNSWDQIEYDAPVSEQALQSIKELETELVIHRVF